MNSNNIIETLEQEAQASTALRSKLVNRVLIPVPEQVINGITYNAPNNFGVYKETGGACFGVVGDTYSPIDLNRFYDVIERSVLECGNGLKASDITFKEYYGGGKIAFDISLKTSKLNSGLNKPDLMDSKISFYTGFDGRTKTSMNLYTYRLVCSNGMKAWKQDVALSFKNTIGNNGKELFLCNEIFQGLQGLETYVEKMNELAKVKITRKQLMEFVTKVTGYDHETESTKQKNILSKLIADIETEMNATDMTAFSLLQGVTRYTSHTLAKNEESQLFGSAAKMNAEALELVSLFN